MFIDIYPRIKFPDVGYNGSMKAVIKRAVSKYNNNSKNSAEEYEENQNDDANKKNDNNDNKKNK